MGFPLIMVKKYARRPMKLADNSPLRTIYNKGAEVIRMMYTILGKSAFRKATDLYFERHEAQSGPSLVTSRLFLSGLGALGAQGMQAHFIT